MHRLKAWERLFQFPMEGITVGLYRLKLDGIGRRMNQGRWCSGAGGGRASCPESSDGRGDT
jgi:hypothetical protein